LALYALHVTSLFKFCITLVWWWSERPEVVGTNIIKTVVVFDRIHTYFTLLFYFGQNEMSSIKIKTFIFYSGHLEFCNITLHLRIKKQIFPLF